MDQGSFISIIDRTANVCYYVTVMKNTQTQQTTDFNIYRDGRIDRLFQIRRQLQKTTNTAGRLIYKSIELSVNVLDELCTEYQKL